MKSIHRAAVRLLVVVSVLLALGRGADTAEASPPAQDSTHLAYDQSVEGRITEDSTGQRWTFTGQAGDLVLIDMRAADDSTLDTLLTLLDPDGNTIRTDDDGGEGLNSRIGPYPVEQDGVYTVIAASYNGAGTYTIAVRNLNTIATLASGKPLVGTLNAEHPADYFHLEAPPADTSPLVQFTISDDDPYTDPLLSIYSAAGFVAGTEQVLDQQLSTLDPVALLPGEIYVAVVSWNPEGAGGNYQLNMSASTLTLLEDGVPQSGSLDYSTLYQRHYFIAQQADALRVTVQAEGDITPAITITAAGMESYLFSNDGEAVRELTALVTVPETGVYYVEVADGSFQGNTGGYSLQLDWVTE